MLPPLPAAAAYEVAMRESQDVMMLDLRSATLDDEDLLLKWRNDPATRRASFRSDEISSADHHRWFLEKLEDPDCAILVVEVDGLPVGQIRLDRVAVGVAEISIGLAAEVRGRGFGRKALLRAVPEAKRLLGACCIKALVKRGNAASLAAFASAGFRVIREDGTVVELEHGPTVSGAD
jgi:RimJ/RimL family protein N-acetyltransferase